MEKLLNAIRNVNYQVCELRVKCRKALGQGTGREFAGGTDVCVCPSCKAEVKHERGVPCNKVKCPKCGALMTGKGVPGSKV